MKAIIITIQAIVSVANCANILAWFHAPSISHQIVFQPIWKELSLRGHHVTVITPDPLKDPALTNLTEINTHFTYQVWKEIDISNMRRDEINAFLMEYYFKKARCRVIEMVIDTKEIQEILRKPKDYYDLILIEANNFLLYGLQNKFDAPLIALSSFDIYNYLVVLFGISSHPAIYSDILTGYRGKMSLLQKLDNLHLEVGIYLLNKYFYMPVHDKIARSYFGNDMPYLENLIKKTSLLFGNVNPVFSSNKPLPPNVMHYTIVNINRTRLDTDLQKILDNAKDGFVYFSLGTNVRFDHVEGDIKVTLMETLGKLPYTVLCKWDSEDHPKKPNNVILRKWFPQQSVLAHENIKVFVTQGGLQSSEEAIIHAVPLVVIPFLGDQPLNAKILTSHGMAETISPRKITKNNLEEAILKVAQDEKYHLKAKELRVIFLDQPQSGIEKVIWWCEYVIRHKGAKHLRSPGADISLYEYFMLDLLLVLVVVLFVPYKVSRIILSLLFRLFKRTKPEDKKEKSQ